MYSPTGNERLVSLDVPPADAGAPLPALLSEEREALLAYFGSREIEVAHGRDAVVILKFTGAIAVFAGEPDEDAFVAHPLAACGLHPFAFSEVINSPWIRQLERANRVSHPHTSHYERYRHYALPMHDSTIEVVAWDCGVAAIENAPTPAVALAAWRGNH